MVPRVNAPLMESDKRFFIFGGIMSTVEEQLNKLREETLASLKKISTENEKEMQNLRVSVLGKKGSLT